MADHSTPAEARKSARRAFEDAAWTLCTLARDPLCPRLPDDAWNALLRGQRAAEAEDLRRYAGILRAHASRLATVLARG